MFDSAALIVLLSGLVALASWRSVMVHEHDLPVFVAFGLLVAVAIGAAQGCHDVTLLVRWQGAVRAAAWPLLCAVAAVAIALTLSGTALIALALPAVLALAGGLLALTVMRRLCAMIVERANRSRRLSYKVAVFGDLSSATAEKLAAARLPFVETLAVYDTRHSQSEAGAMVDLLLARARRERVDAIILAYPAEAAARLRKALDGLGASIADIFISDDLNRHGMLPAGHPLGGIALLPARRAPLGELDFALKGILDRCGGVALLLMLSPLLALVALAIKLDSPGPILFRQPRVGYNNALFTMHKFRSMHHHVADIHASQQTTQDDRRVTRVGRIIRRLSIDELPQLFNVIAGQMSLIGPRPHAPGTNVDGYLLEHFNASYARRHTVLPGITGWAQINGSRGAISSVGQINSRVALDLYYIDNWSIWLDLKILLLTVVREVVSKRAY